MTKEVKNRFIQGLSLSLMALLLMSSNQTSSFASIHPFKYQKTVAISKQYLVEVSSQTPYETRDSNNQYHIKIYTQLPSKALITAMTRPMSGRISDVIVEDIDDDQMQDIVIMSEDMKNNKNYLMIDTFSFDGKHMIWKQQLPSTLITVNAHPFLSPHEIPNDLPRKTATLLVEK